MTSLRFKLNSFNKILLLVLVKFEFTKTSKSFQNMHFRVKFKTLLKRWKIKLIFFCTLIFFMESNIAIFSQNCLMFYSAGVAGIGMISMFYYRHMWIYLKYTHCFVVKLKFLSTPYENCDKEKLLLISLNEALNNELSWDAGVRNQRERVRTGDYRGTREHTGELDQWKSLGCRDLG